MSGHLSQRRGAANEGQCKAFLGSLGAAVYQTGAPGVPKGKRGHRGTMRTPGTPDFLVFLGGRFFVWEAKAGAANLTPEQRVFRDYAVGARLPFGSGDLDALKRFLRDELGVIEYDERTGIIRKVA